MSAPTPDILIFCDGACSGNPGPGGWGAVIRQGESVRELGGNSPHTTNNKMELTAAIEGLRAIQSTPGLVWVGTDSSYVVKGMTEWIHGWRRKEWRGSTGKPVANRELWEALADDAEARKPAVRWAYVAGHAGIAGNERADAIAAAYAQGQVPKLFTGVVREYTVRIEIPK